MGYYGVLKEVYHIARIGYCRISTAKQKVERQLIELEEYQVEKIFIDRVSGKDTNRTELKKMMEYVREGDILVVTSYSRFSRSVTDLLNLLGELEAKGVRFISIKENIDTSTPVGRLFVSIIASINAFEREQLLERQASGIAAAKRSGVKFGRKGIEIDDKFIKIYKKWKKGEIKGVEAIKDLGYSKSTFYNLVKKHESNG